MNTFKLHLYNIHQDGMEDWLGHYAYSVEIQTEEADERKVVEQFLEKTFYESLSPLSKWCVYGLHAFDKFHIFVNDKVFTVYPQMSWKIGCERGQMLPRQDGNRLFQKRTMRNTSALNYYDEGLATEDIAKDSYAGFWGLMAFCRLEKFMNDPEKCYRIIKKYWDIETNREKKNEVD